ncbi:MAG: 3-keto-5-aminohexanoate cleavage protein [Actinobacteria bacterium]|jgi:uncharacterized protein (DUF849 family)|nr:3-keto-5-aminohexanoate cleavage protein [Actinomycetota bacterium]
MAWTETLAQPEEIRLCGTVDALDSVSAVRYWCFDCRTGQEISVDSIIVTCAVTGSSTNYRSNPAVPITPEQIADSAVESARAGAAMVHIHVREPSGAPSGDVALYAEVVDRIAQSGVDVIVNLTTGYGARFVPSSDNFRSADPSCNFAPPSDRTRHITELRPEVCSLDIATFNFGDDAFVNTPSIVREMSASIVEADVLPEIEVFEVGHLRLARHLIETGVLRPPGHFQFCLGIDWAMPATAAAVGFLRDLLPPNATWSAFGIGRHQFPMVATAAAMGGHVRVGLEDNIYLSQGDLAPSNAALVERAVRIIGDVGRRPATPNEARELLGLAPR